MVQCVGKEIKSTAITSSFTAMKLSSSVADVVIKQDLGSFRENYLRIVLNYQMLIKIKIP